LRGLDDGFAVTLAAGATSIASGMPHLSTAIWILTSRIFLPPSLPRANQRGAERQDRLSMTTGSDPDRALEENISIMAKPIIRRYNSPAGGWGALEATGNRQDHPAGRSS
jgi:hypothetical protein